MLLLCWLCSNEAKHRERFAVRAKHMTLDPAGNRYIKYIRNIRAIQVPDLACSMRPQLYCLIDVNIF